MRKCDLIHAGSTPIFTLPPLNNTNDEPTSELGKLEAVRAYIDSERRADREHIATLERELEALSAERDNLAKMLEAASARAAVLKAKLVTEGEANAALQDECDVQSERIATLERQVNTLLSSSSKPGRVDELTDSMIEERVPCIVDDPNNKTLLDADEFMDAFDALEHLETKADFSDRDLPSASRLQPAIDNSLLTSVGAQPVDDVAQHNALVRLTHDNDDGAVHVLSKPLTTIGRAWSNDIRINEITVSRTHARLRVEDTGITIEDAGSKNGLVVNARIVEHAELKHGDVISIGSYDFRYVVVEQATRTH